MKLQESKIYEALPVSLAKDYVGIQRRKEVDERLKKIFKDLSELPGSKQSKRGDRVYFEFLHGDKPKDLKKSDVKSQIEEAFSSSGYKIKDYIQGTAHEEKHNRIVKIGTALKKIGREDLINKFNADEIRAAGKQSITKYIVFSKHPYDIAGMSSDRGWTSCTNILPSTRGINAHRVKFDVEEGSIICYVVNANDMNIKKPSARVIFKPLIRTSGSRDIVYFPDTVYGTADVKFVDFAKSILDKVQEFIPGKFTIASPDVYSDTLSGVKDIHSSGYYNAMSGQERPKTREVVEEILLDLNITNYTINNDLSVDVKGRVNLAGKELSTIPVNFRRVDGDFICADNPITSLEGSPTEVDGFCCIGTEIKNLVGGPKIVKTNYACNGNQLESLEGSPENVGESFICMDAGLKSLKGGPKTVGGFFDCSWNNLKSFDGAPKKVGGEFSCIHNNPPITKEQKKLLMSTVTAGSFDCPVHLEPLF